MKTIVLAPHRGRALSLVTRLMAIPGRSGQESRVAQFITGQLKRAGVPAAAIQTDNAHRRTPIRGDTGNLVVKLPGTHRGPRRLLMAHMDTVPICVGSKPVARKGLIVSANPETGLGADDRAGAAVVLQAALEIVRRKLPHPPLTFCWTIQEENGLHGARLIRKSLLGNPRLAFNWDGGAPEKLTIGATGGYRMLVQIRGVASHAGGAPDWGISAIAIAALGISELERDGWHGLIRKGNQRGTSNIGSVHGGEATNVVTDYVALKAEARSHNPRFRKRIRDRIESAFHRAARQVTNVAGDRGKVTVDGRLDYESFRLTGDEPCIQVAEEAVRAVGRNPRRDIANGGVDANWLVTHGIDMVTLGCGQLNQHTVTEALDIKSYHDACRIALVLATATEK